MNFLFFKDKKLDSQLAEYDRAVVERGLEKAALEREVEKKKRELKTVNDSYDLVRVVFLRNYEKLTDEEKKEVGDKASVLAGFDNRISEGRYELEKLFLEKDKIKGKIAEEEKKISAFGAIFDNLNLKIKNASLEFHTLSQTVENKNREAATAFNQSEKAKKDLNSIRLEIDSVGKNKIELLTSIDKAEKDLKEINEIISILQSTNKEGLNVIASFEGERKRLQDKEEKLDQTKHDLGIYAKRLKIEREKAGIKTPMTLPVDLE